MRPSLIAPFLILTAAASLILAGCSKKSADVSAHDGASAADFFKPVTGLAAPAWKLKTPDGRELSSAEFAGKLVVLDIWATWCPPCRAEIPAYIALQEKYREQGVVIVGLSVDEDIAALKQYMADQKINYPIAMADEAVQQNLGGIEGYPTTFIIDRKGQVVLKKIGGAPHEAIEAAIKRHL